MEASIKIVRFKVFIVDDSSLVVERLKLLLNDYKHLSVVGSATNINSALTSVNKLQPNVIVMDIHLKDDAPYANGTDLLAMLRKKYPSALLIMLSNLSTPQYVKRCMELGADYFLDKSNDFEKIPEILTGFYNSDLNLKPLAV